jgi:integrase
MRGSSRMVQTLCPVAFLSALSVLAGCTYLSSEPSPPYNRTPYGIRASKLLSLTWADVDFDRRTVTVRAGYAKNGESRSVPMNELLTRTLQKVRISHGPVFRSRTRAPYRSFRTAFENAVRRAEIPDFTFHDLRHTFASRLVMGGIDFPTVKELMGHKDITMTLRYSHLSDDHKQRAVAILSAPIFAPPEED